MTDTITPYSTVTPYGVGYPNWVTEEDLERIQSYITYDAMYWNEDSTFQLIRRTEDGAPIYLPKPKVIVDTTAHYLLKGLTITLEDQEGQAELWKFMTDFFNRERFYSRFAVAKQHGVCLGDWIFHITANPLKAEGTRVSLNSVDPGAYFPEYDPDDMEHVTGVKLVEQWPSPDDPKKTVLKILRYWKDPKAPTTVMREENLWEMEGWNNPERATKLKQLIPAAPLPVQITQIPVYHFKNYEWGKLPFGSSELKGLERIFVAMDQAISDEEIALALVGLGVYATDAGRPKDEEGNEVDWQVSPGMVWEMPGATMVKKLEGISSVTPVLDHLRYLDEAWQQASGTSDVALGNVDAQTAESGIALAIKFIPTLAKIEHRDTAGLELITQMFYDLKFWWWAYESKNWTTVDLIPVLGQKLPINRDQVVNELNNMRDRKIISKKYYRRIMTQELSYVFPPTIDQEILDEQRADLELLQQFRPVVVGAETEQEGASGASGSPAPANGVPGPGGRKQGAGDTVPKGSTSNNKGRVNESNGTEAKQ